MAKMQPLDLNKQTVFILGAGASQPYGLPLGIHLKSQMISNVSLSACKKVLLNSGYTQSLIDEFAEALSYTSHPTIDIFLEKKKKFRSLGAYLIAFTLLPLENNTKLFPAHDWYSHLYDVIDFEHVEPDANNIAFVSLNYDRSLEHFLMNNYKYNCHEDLYDIAEDKARNLKVVHAHGSLGRYPEMSYGISRNQEGVLRNAGESIRIISDRIEDSDDFRTAQETIKNAFNIVFIGFGYDPTTLGLLTQHIDLSNKRILGTAYHLEQPKIDRLNKLFEGNIEITPTGETADEFCRDIFRRVSFTE